MDETEKILDGFCKDYCPPLEEATLRAICSDYNLESSDEYQACVGTLTQIISETVAEKATGFDPSGTSGADTQDSGICSESQSSRAEAQDIQSNDTGPSDQEEDPFSTSQNLDGASIDAKTAWLVEMFPDEPTETIANRLTRCGGNITRTIEELLNPLSTNAVDAFALGDDQQVRNKKRRKRKKSASSELRGELRSESYMGSDYDPDRMIQGAKRPHTPVTPKVRYTRIPGVDIGRKYAPLNIEAESQKQGARNQVNRSNSNQTGPVAPRPSPNIVDLHGYIVADAVRVATDAVWAWWEGLGDRKYASGGGGPVREGFRCITGVGHHSIGGRPRIRPAVAHRLVKDGWKVTVQEGEILVTGRVRRT